MKEPIEKRRPGRPRKDDRNLFPDAARKREERDAKRLASLHIADLIVSPAEITALIGDDAPKKERGKVYRAIVSARREKRKLDYRQIKKDRTK